MEIFVAFDNTYHILPVSFWFCILFVCSTVTLQFAVKSIPKKDSSQRITILQYFVFCKNLLDTNPPPRIFRSIVSEMIRGKYLLLAYSFFGKAFRLRVPI